MTSSQASRTQRSTRNDRQEFLATGRTDLRRRRAVLQLIRAVSGAPVTIGTTISIPLWASWVAVACVVAAILAWSGFAASRN